MTREKLRDDKVTDVLVGPVRKVARYARYE